MYRFGSLTVLFYVHIYYAYVKYNCTVIFKGVRCKNSSLQKLPKKMHKFIMHKLLCIHNKFMHFLMNFLQT